MTTTTNTTTNIKSNANDISKTNIKSNYNNFLWVEGEQIAPLIDKLIRLTVKLTDTNSQNILPCIELIQENVKNDKLIEIKIFFTENDIFYDVENIKNSTIQKIPENQKILQEWKIKVISSDTELKTNTVTFLQRLDV